MLTANRLGDGEVVYWRAGGWSETFSDGEVFDRELEAQAALAAAQHFAARNAVVNPYLFDVRRETDGIRPVKEREVIRALGPSVRGDLGKQARSATARQSEFGKRNSEDQPVPEGTDDDYRI